jgi:hypothetical protein
VALRIHHVAGRTPDGVKRLDQRNACRKHGGERARPARNAGFFDQYTKDGQLEQEPVHEHLHLLVAPPGLHEEIEPPPNAAENQPPVLDKELADRDDEQRRCGQIGTEDVNTS